MKTKIVYVLTFDDSNYYFEQLMLSACSARTHNPDAEIIVVTDKDSAALIVGWREEIYKYVTEVKSIELPEKLTKMQRSRWLKTNLRSIISGDYLFVDTDTIICKNLSDIDSLDGDICAVADGHVPFSQNEFVDVVKRQLAQLEVEVSQDIVYFNSGVMYVKDTPLAHDFCRTWHETWLHSCEISMFVDQPSLGTANHKYNYVIKEIPGQWNCQLSERFLNSFQDAYILHYFSCKDIKDEALYYFKRLSTHMKVREEKGISDEMKERILHPYLQFYANYMILSGKSFDTYKKVNFFSRLCQGSPRRYRLIEKIARFLS